MADLNLRYAAFTASRTPPLPPGEPLARYYALVGGNPYLVQRGLHEMAARGLPTDLWGLDAEAFGAPPSSIDLVLDVEPFLDAKLRALRCHRSQLGAGHLLAEMPEDLARRFLGTEYFIGGELAHSKLARLVGGAVGARAPEHR